MSRQRMTWTDAGVSRHASEHPATPDEGPASPAHKAQPGPDAYKSGDTSSWAEDVHPGPYENGEHPATPDEGPASPAYKAAALERKAAKCIRLATAMLGEGATVAAIENQALELMDLPDRSIKASLSRLAEDADEAIDDDDAAEAEADLAEEGKKKASVSDRIARLERVLVKLAESEDPEGDGDDSESEDPEGDDDDDGSEDPGEDEDMKKSASDDDDDEDDESMQKKSALERRMDRIERVLHRLAAGKDDGESKGDQSKTHIDYANAKDGDKETGHGESAGDQSKSHEDYEGKKASDDDDESMDDEESKKKAGWEPGHRAEGGWDPGHMESMSDDESMLEEMMLEEMLAEESMDQNDPEAFYGDDPSGDGVPEIIEAEGVVESMMDPMGLDDEIVEEDDMMILASLFGKEADLKDEDKKEKEDHEKGAVADDKDHIKKLEKDEAEDAKDLEKDEESKKKASLRPQPKRASTGAKTLGGVSKEAASEVGDLSKLWDSAPDVSRFF